jgi:hypothetical protein
MEVGCAYEATVEQHTAYQRQAASNARFPNCVCSGAGPACSSTTDSGAYCYTEPGACPDGRPSRRLQDMEYSFAACAPLIAPHEDFTFDPYFRRVTLDQVLAGNVLAGMELAEVSARVSTELAAMTASTPTISIVSSFSVPLGQFPSISTYYTYLQTSQRLHRSYLQSVCDVADGAVDDDASAIATAASLGQTIEGCAGVTSLCNDASYGNTTQSLCPVTCGCAAFSASTSAWSAFFHPWVGSNQEDFEDGFKSAFAANLGGGGVMTADQIVIDGISELTRTTRTTDDDEHEDEHDEHDEEGHRASTHLDVSFHIDVRAAVKDDVASLLYTLKASDVTLSVIVDNTTFSVTAASLAEPTTRHNDFVSDADNSCVIEVVDIDSDSDLDIIVGNRSPKFGSISQTNQNSMFINEGHGGFRRVIHGVFVTDASDSRSLDIADIDGDGDLDIVIGNMATSNAIYMNDGSGEFWKVQVGVFVRDAANTRDLRVEDIDGDGKLDVYVSNFGSVNSLFLGRGGGEFMPALGSNSVKASGKSVSVDLADVDGDEILDVVEAVSEIQMCTIYASRDVAGTSREFQKATFDGTSTDGLNVDLSFVTDNRNADALKFRAADIDGDGDLDILAVHHGVSNNSMYLNMGGGVTSKVTSGAFVTDGGDSRDLELVDMDSDGDLDIVVVNSGERNFLYVNEGGEEFRKVEGGAFVLDSGRARCVKAADIDGDGDPDLLGGNGGEANSLFINQGGFKFRKVKPNFEIKHIATIAPNMSFY